MGEAESPDASAEGLRFTRREIGCALVLGVVSFLPYLRGVLAGRAFFFRDLSLAFFPFRLFIAEGLRSGELRFWNPLVHEGVPLTLSPLAYPLDWIQALAPTVATLTLTLALHGPLAAVGAFVLARGLGLPRSSAAVSAIIYSLGGFYLSSLNLYVHAEAMAWAPFVVWAMVRAGGRAGIAVVAVTTAISISTTGVEIVLLACVAGLALQVSVDWRHAAKRGIPGIALGAGLAAPILAGLMALTVLSPRAEGLAAGEVVAFSISPFQMFQAVWSNLLGDPERFVDTFWAGEVVTDKFPYFISLYLGPLVVALAAAGAFRPSRWRRGLLLLLALGVLVSLGRHVGLGSVVGISSVLRVFRYPSKAYFLVHLTVALLAGSGLAGLTETSAKGRRVFALAGLGSAVAFVLPLAVTAAVPSLQRSLYPLLNPLDQNAGVARALASGLAAGAVPLAVASFMTWVPGFAVLRPSLLRRLLFPALVAADLIRAGAGLNPMVDVRFYQLSPGLARLLPELRNGRVLSCDPTGTSLFGHAFATRISDHEIWTFALLRDTLSPYANMPVGVRGALGIDPTGLVPAERSLSPGLARCLDFPAIAPRVRSAAVTHVLTTIPLRHPTLGPPEILASPDAAPLSIFVQKVLDPLPLWEVLVDPVDGPVPGAWLVAAKPGSWAFRVNGRSAARLVVREAWAEGWWAEVDGEPRDVGRDEHGHMIVTLRPGEASVRLAYRPPWLTGSVSLSGATLLGLIGLALLERRRMSASRRSSRRIT